MNARVNSPLVSVIIETETASPSLRSVGQRHGQTLRSFETVVIDDPSSDGTGDRLAGQSDEQLTAIVLDDQVGRAACDRRLAQAQGPSVLFLDGGDRRAIVCGEIVCGEVERVAIRQARYRGSMEAGQSKRGHEFAKKGRQSLQCTGSVI
jgi:hypothetical protein